jgi:hypothetical protein
VVFSSAAFVLRQERHYTEMGEGDVETNDREKLMTCDGTECYCNSPERTILKDIQRGTVPDGAFPKRCCWSKICSVRQKYGYMVSKRSEAWRELCARMGSIRTRTGWVIPRVHREPLLEALRNARRKADTETKGDLNAQLAVKELTRY